MEDAIVLNLREERFFAFAVKYNYMDYLHQFQVETLLKMYTFFMFPEETNSVWQGLNLHYSAAEELRSNTGLSYEMNLLLLRFLLLFLLDR